MLCILYVIAVGTCLGLAGLLLESSLPAGRPRRWVWCITIALSIVIPAVYRTQHNATVASLADVAANTSWWVRIGAFDSMLGQLWGVSSLLLIAWGMASVLWTGYLMRRTQRDRTVVNGVDAVVTDSLGPATFGLWRSRIVIPRWVLALPATHRQYVLQHEDEHRRANDARLLFFSSMVLVLLPWNLALWWQLRRLRLAVEMDCDDRVVASLGNASAYSQLLFDIAQASSRAPRLQPGFLGGFGSLERRLKRLVSPPRLTRAQRQLLAVLTIIMMFIVLSAPHPVTEAELAGHDSKSHITQQ